MTNKTRNIVLLGIDAGIIALLSLIGVAFFWTIIDSIDLFNPLDEYFEDYDYADRYFAGIVNDEIPTSEEIFIVNFGYLNRQEIAEQIQILQMFQPAVIGIDAVFAEKRDDRDTILKNALSLENIVVGCFAKFRNNIPIEVIKPNSYFGNLKIGHLEFISEDVSVRVIEKYIIFEDIVINSFPVEIARQYQYDKFLKFAERDKKVEVINYRGGKVPFKVFDYEDIYPENDDLYQIKDKIVLLAYYREFKNAPCDTIDSHFSPVSKSEYGHADTKGIEIHAHVIDMILREDFINEISEVTTYIIAFIVCFVFQLWLIYYFKKDLKYFDITSKPLLFIVIICNMFITYQIFAHYKLKIDMIPTNLVLFLSGEVFRFYEETTRILKIKTYITK